MLVEQTKTSRPRAMLSIRQSTMPPEFATCLRIFQSQVPDLSRNRTMTASFRLARFYQALEAIDGSLAIYAQRSLLTRDRRGFGCHSAAPV
jgi:hypothetical protein